jgi:hypothetical protein
VRLRDIKFSYTHMTRIRDHAIWILHRHHGRTGLPDPRHERYRQRDLDDLYEDGKPFGIRRLGWRAGILASFGSESSSDAVG